MEDTSFYNNKYSSLDSLITSKGDLNSAIIRREWFKKLDIYRYIVENTKNLDIFEDISFNDRFTTLYNNISVKNCNKCGKPYIYIPKSQHLYRICNHKFNSNHKKHSISKIISNQNKNNKFIAELKNRELILNDEEFIQLNERLFQSPKNNAFLITSNTEDFYHDLIIRTENILPFNDDEFRFSERMYIVRNNITEIPHCEYCDEKSRFINRFVGYSRSCIKHRHLKSNVTRAENIRKFIDDNLNHEKYEIVKYPSLLNNEDIIIKCRKCGCESAWHLNNGKIDSINKKSLCRKCEHSVSKEEESLYNFIKDIYKGEIIHHTNGRSVISPYEIDIYLKERNLGIEFDGIHWHSENGGGKNSSYHLNKTEMCETKGIQLIHIFENEWINNEDIVKSRIKNMLGVYEKTIYARKCVIREIDNRTSIEFQKNNHIQGAVNSSVNIGLFNDNELVSVMTFGKPRMNRKYDWELLRFCNKLNYHIVGGASKLLRYFERSYKPNTIISYADRRWSIGNLYEKLGFNLSHKSKPNYWYFKENEPYNLMNRIKFQKFRLKGILDKYEENITEFENMKNNGYDRIFDCGNLVFIKDYNHTK